MDVNTSFKRARPQNEHLPVSKKPREDGQTPAAVRDGLAGLLKNPSVGHIATVAKLFDALAKAQVDTHRDKPLRVSRSLPNTVFNTLLRQHEYEAFAAAFTLYNAIRQADSQAAGTTYTTRLTLQMPAGWVAEDKAAMVAAFSNIDARCVVVAAPDGRGGEVAIPADVSDCLVALLQAGTTALNVSGMLTDPAPVARAFAQSRLQALALGGGSGFLGREVSPQTARDRLQSHAVLMRGLVHCPTLERLNVTDAGVLTLHAVLDECLHPGGPALKSVALGGWTVEASTPGLVPFVRAIAKFPTLSSVDATCTLYCGEGLSDVFLNPLYGHRSLSRLHVGGFGSIAPDERQMTVLPTVIAFAAGTPCLSDFAWNNAQADDDAGSAMERYRRRGGRLYSTQGLREMERALADPDFKLKTLRLRGIAVPPGVMGAFCKALARNTSLRSVDLTSCFLPLKPLLVDLMKSLDSNATLETFVLSHEFDDYYLISEDRTVRGFVRSDPDVDEEQEALDDFTLRFLEGEDDGIRDPAIAAFEPFKNQAHSFFEDLKTQLAQRRGQALIQRAQFELGENIQALMNAALTAVAPVHNKDDPEQFRLPALQIVAQLVGPASLPGVIHLSEVSKASDPYLQHEQTRATTEAGQELKALVELDRRRSERADLADNSDDREDGEDDRKAAAAGLDSEEFRKASKDPYHQPWSLYGEDPDEEQMSDLGKPDPPGLARTPALNTQAEDPLMLAAIAPQNAMAPPVQPMAGLSAEQQALFDQAMGLIREGDHDGLWTLTEAGGVPLNAVTNAGGNALLVLAAMVNNPMIVSTLLHQGAFDHGRQAEAMSPSEAVRASFHVYQPPVAATAAAAVQQPVTIQGVDPGTAEVEAQDLALGYANPDDFDMDWNPDDLPS